MKTKLFFFFFFLTVVYASAQTTVTTSRQGFTVDGYTYLYDFEIESQNPVIHLNHVHPGNDVKLVYNVDQRLIQFIFANCITYTYPWDEKDVSYLDSYRYQYIYTTTDSRLVIIFDQNGYPRQIKFAGGPVRTQPNLLITIVVD